MVACDTLADMESTLPEPFFSQDAKYRKWLDRNPDGYVLNIGGFLIHDARCWLIQNRSTTKPWGKVCSLNRAALKKWLKKEYGSDEIQARLLG